MLKKTISNLDKRFWRSIMRKKGRNKTKCNFHLYEMCRPGKSTETEGRWGALRVRDQLANNGTASPSRVMKTFWIRFWGWLYSSVIMLNARLYTLKWLHWWILRGMNFTLIKKQEQTKCICLTPKRGWAWGFGIFTYMEHFFCHFSTAPGHGVWMQKLW